jgi:hypothetical protein
MTLLLPQSHVAALCRTCEHIVARSAHTHKHTHAATHTYFTGENIGDVNTNSNRLEGRVCVCMQSYKYIVHIHSMMHDI